MSSKNQLANYLVLFAFLLSSISVSMTTCYTTSCFVESSQPVIVQFGEDEATSVAVAFLRSHLDEKLFINPSIDDYVEIEQIYRGEIFIVGHGAKQGLLIDGNVLPWEGLEKVINQSPSRSHYILACQSVILAENSKVILTFECDIDAEVAATTAIAKYDLLSWINADNRINKISSLENSDDLNSINHLSFLELKHEVNSELIAKINHYYEVIYQLFITKTMSDSFLLLNWFWSYVPGFNLMSGNEMLWAVWGVLFCVIGFLAGFGYGNAIKAQMKAAVWAYAAAGFISNIVDMMGVTVGFFNGYILIDAWLLNIIPSILTLIFTFLLPLLDFFGIITLTALFGLNALTLLGVLSTILTAVQVGVVIVGTLSDILDSNMESSIWL